MWARALTMIAVISLTMCALPPAAKDQAYLTYDIQNFNWANATVTFLCDGSYVDREFSIETGAHVRGRIPLRRSCNNPEFLVELLARREVYTSGVVTAWDRSSTLFIRIENSLNLTSYRVYQ